MIRSIGWTWQASLQNGQSLLIVEEQSAGGHMI